MPIAPFDYGPRPFGFTSFPSVRAGLRSSAPLEAVLSRVREKVRAHGQDRVLGPEIEALAHLLRTGAVLDAAEAACGTLE